MTIRLIAGQVDVLFASITAAMELIRAGRVQALAVTAPARWPALPDVPAVGEFVAGYELVSWVGIGAHRLFRAYVSSGQL